MSERQGAMAAADVEKPVQAATGGLGSPASTRPSTGPRVGIVIVTYDGYAHTGRCLRSLRNVDYPNRIVVLVDNASKDGTPERVLSEFPETVVLRQSTNLGFTGGNNIGIRWCLEHGTDAVLLLNNDTEVEPEFLRRLVRDLEHADVVVPRIRPLRPDGPLDEGIGSFDWRRGIARPPSWDAPVRSDGPPTRIASGCCLLCTRAVFESVGGFDEDFFTYFEDVDLVVRAQLAGFAIGHVPDALVHHFGRGSGGGDGSGVAPVTLYYNTRNRLHLMRKYGRMGAAFGAYFLVTRTAYAVRYAVRGEWPLLRSMFRGIRDALMGKLARADYRW